MKTEEEIDKEYLLILSLIKRFMDDTEKSINDKKAVAMTIASEAIDLATGADLDEGIELFEMVLEEIQLRRQTLN
jgi:hypothetical protein